jgi:DNA repair/transcription protein MET18/MMS19
MYRHEVTYADLNQKEVLVTLAACCASYKHSTLNYWSSKIWDALKFEVWNGEEEDSIKGSLYVIHNLSESLIKPPFPLEWDLNEDYLSYFAIPAITECSKRLHDSWKQYLIPSGRILQAIGSASPYSFYLVIKKVLPALLLIWQDSKLGSEKKSLLTVLNNILQARVDQIVTDNFVPGRLEEEEMPRETQEYHFESTKKMSEAFGRFRDGLVEVYSAAVSDMKKVLGLQDDSFALPAIQGLALLFKIPGYLSDAEMGMVVEQLNRIALDLHGKEEIHAEALSALHQISVEAEGVFKITLSNYILELPEKLSPINSESHAEELESVIFKLQDLMELSCTAPPNLRRTDQKTTTKMWHDHFLELQRKLSDKLQSVLQHGSQQDYANAILATICTSVQRFDETAQLKIDLDPTLLGTYNTIVLDIIVKLVEQKSGPASNNLRYTAIKTLPSGKIFGDTFVQFAGRTAMYALRSKLSVGQNSFIAEWNRKSAGEPNCVWELFTHGDGTIGRAKQSDLTAGPPEKCLANFLSMSFVAGLRSEVCFPFLVSLQPC